MTKTGAAPSGPSGTRVSLAPFSFGASCQASLLLRLRFLVGQEMPKHAWEAGRLHGRCHPTPASGAANTEPAGKQEAPGVRPGLLPACKTLARRPHGTPIPKGADWHTRNRTGRCEASSLHLEGAWHLPTMPSEAGRTPRPSLHHFPPGGHPRAR